MLLVSSNCRMLMLKKSSLAALSPDTPRSGGKTRTSMPCSAAPRLKDSRNGGSWRQPKPDHNMSEICKFAASNEISSDGIACTANERWQLHRLPSLLGRSKSHVLTIWAIYMGHVPTNSGWKRGTQQGSLCRNSSDCISIATWGGV